MNNAEAMNTIINEYNKGISESKKVKLISEKIKNKTATYADAYEYARESSAIMSGSMKKNLPRVLTNGNLYRDTANQVLKKPLIRGSKDVMSTTAKIQNNLNEIANIGINAVYPEVNEDYINGIINGICNAESFEAGAENLFDGIENYLEGIIDDFVHDNAEFHYQAGLSPKIIRQAAAGCCKWCSALGGTYEYEKVRNTGNDVFRRHKNCHCIVLYDPADGAKNRQNVHTKRFEST